MSAIEGRADPNAVGVNVDIVHRQRVAAPRWKRLTAAVCAACLVVVCATCGETTSGPEEETHSDQAINDYVQGLSYDPAALLQVRDIPGSEQLTAAGDPVDTEEEQGANLLTCRAVDYNLESNAEDVAILRPTNGIVWPGALVKANLALLNGTPEPITLAPGPITLRVDLPGIGEHGTFVVDDPSNSAVQAALDGVLDWWNDNAYQEGYVNPSNSSYRAATSYSSEQLAINVGLNVKWASGSVASQFGYTSSTTKTVAMMVYRQVFYTVTLDTPDSPAAMFANSVLPSTLPTQMTDAAPPAYVHAVNYGRIIMFRMETSEAVKAIDMEATMKYAAGVSVDMSLESKYKSILQKSSISAITIGGNAEVASQAVTAQSFGDLVPIITGENAVYSKSNPGVPIAYTIRFLKDNSIAKMGYTTDYTANECTLWKQSVLDVRNDGGYVARAFVTYYPRNATEIVKLSSGNYTAGVTRSFTVPAGATQVTLWADAAVFIATWGLIGRQYWEVAPEYAKYCLKGTTLDKWWTTC
jgi:thiol-activated cytolysin